MAEGCDVIVREDMVLDLLEDPVIREKYQRFAFEDYVNVSARTNSDVNSGTIPM